MSRFAQDLAIVLVLEIDDGGIDDSTYLVTFDLDVVDDCGFVSVTWYI